MYVAVVEQQRDFSSILPSVDIIVPVYGAAAEFELCFASALEHTNWNRRRLIIVDDAGPDFPSAESLTERAEKSGAPFLLLRNPINRGYVASVNRAIAQSDTTDVVLLNSDTVVTPGWVDKLQTAAHSAPNIATVTPFSNNATICSIPRAHEANAIPTGYDATSLGALVERVSIREYPRIPTGVGFCLYIRRDALWCVSIFDERPLRGGLRRRGGFLPVRAQSGIGARTRRRDLRFSRGPEQFWKKPHPARPRCRANDAPAAPRLSKSDRRLHSR
jgi:glycosyltransferase involved in cell wall biosynthesis